MLLIGDEMNTLWNLIVYISNGTIDPFSMSVSKREKEIHINRR